MIGFENFDVRSWVDQGLTVWVQTDKPLNAPVPRRKPWRTTLVAPVAAVSMALAMFPLGASAAALQINVPAPVNSAVAPDELVSSSYLQEVAKAMSSWQMVTEAAVELPDPIF